MEGYQTKKCAVEAERLNALESQLKNLQVRLAELRGYL
jgi:hypothetical protein